VQLVGGQGRRATGALRVTTTATACRVT
jgi:hypothetical protein